MRTTIFTAMLALSTTAAIAQVPGTVGPPPDSRMSPGRDGPTLACRLFDYGCRPAPEPIAAPPIGEERQIVPNPKKRKAKPKNVKPERAPMPDDE